MTIGIILIILGVVLILVSGRLTGHYFKQRLPLDALSSHEKADMMEASAGKGVIPTWVSGMNLLGWVVAVIGVVVLIAA